MTDCNPGTPAHDGVFKNEIVASNRSAADQDGIMPDTSIIKVDAAHSPKGPEGQKYLADGRAISMRLWENEPPGAAKPPVRRAYETVGYVISGRAELTIEGQTVLLQPGSSWVVPKGAEHTYRVLEGFTAVEATPPPAEMHDRDAPPKS